MTDRAAAEAAVRTILQFIGEDPDREGVRDTPRRVVQSLLDQTAGLRNPPPERHLKVTFDAKGYDQIIVLRGIEFTSLCEHHLLPFAGVAHVCYIPGMSYADCPHHTTRLMQCEHRHDGPHKIEAGYRVVGLSKLARLVVEYARRPQLQEQLTQQIATALDNALNPRGVGVIIEAAHQCMQCRGVRLQGSRMRTSAMLGVLREDAAARAEAMTLLLTPAE